MIDFLTLCQCHNQREAIIVTGFICFWIPSGHLVIDLCCYGNDILFEYYDRDVRFSEDFEKISMNIGSMTSVRRYVLPLELDGKVMVIGVHNFHFTKGTSKEDLGVDT